MAKKYLLALDQGTTSSRAIIFDSSGKIVSQEFIEFTQIFPRAGWVEHNPEDIWNSQIGAARVAFAKAGIPPGEIAAAGIANQRETVLMWNRKTGAPVYNAIVWQCRRTAAYCEKLKKDGCEKAIREKTGLPVDPYFSATKIAWLLENAPGARAAAEKGELLCGTVDTYLLWRLTGGRVHATDYTNASRTMLFNIHKLRWDEELLKLFRIPPALLPEVKESAGYFGDIEKGILPDCETGIYALAGDQQAALFGQGCFEGGSVKNTYGTGCFLLMNTGASAVNSKYGLLTTLNAQTKNHLPSYALEGSVFTGGAAIQWLRDGLGVIKTAAESEQLARSVPDTGGVIFVPAFTGLGAPHWNMYARGTISGITRGTKREHLVRAALEAIALESFDLIDAMRRDSGLDVKSVRVDGGACKNNFLMQFHADIAGCAVTRPAVTETTALGAALLAGLGVRMWPDAKILKLKTDAEFFPAMDRPEREKRLSLWRGAVAQCCAQR
jgi:glycerol kinase